MIVQYHIAQFEAYKMAPDFKTALIHSTMACLNLKPIPFPNEPFVPFEAFSDHTQLMFFLHVLMLPSSS